MIRKYLGEGANFMPTEYDSHSGGQWLTIQEYSQFKSLSISSIRRYIKANRVKWKKKEGKYLIFVDAQKLKPVKENQEQELVSLRLQVNDLQHKIKKLSEENDELKMLVQIYESKEKTKQPPLPPEARQ